MGYLGLEEAERALKLGAYIQAFEIFVAMTESGEDPAFYKLCEMALNGQLQPEQVKQLETRLERAIENDNDAATYNSAVLISRGVVFPRDLEKAADLFRITCSRRLPESFNALAQLYLNNLGEIPLATSDNILDLLEQGIKLGSPDCAYLMGRIYAKGELFRADPYKAVKYLYAAARFGHEEAKKALVLIQTMNPGEPFRRQQEEGTELYWRMKNPDLHAERRDD